MSAPIRPDQFTTGITPVNVETLAEIMESVIARGDLSKLSDEERTNYYLKVCETAGLNPITQPFQYITLNNHLTLYARKDATDQLRRIHKVSVVELAETLHEGVFIVTAKVENAEGRTDAAKGAVNVAGLKGDALANALMKCETKAKRRATLSICGLGFLDETEIETIPAASREPIAPAIKPMTKAQARPAYTRLQAEIDATTSRVELDQWAERNLERINVLPDDWKEHLRTRYSEMMDCLREREANATPEHDADGVVWEEDGERPATPADRLQIEGRKVIGNFPPNSVRPIVSAIDKPVTQKVPLAVEINDGIPEFLRREPDAPIDHNTWIKEMLEQ